MTFNPDKPHNWKNPNAARDGMHPCGPACATSTRCRQCELRLTIYGSRRAHRFGAASTIPSMRYMRQWRRHRLSPSRPNTDKLRLARASAVVRMLMLSEVVDDFWNERGTSPWSGAAFKVFNKVKHDPSAMLGMVKLMESWTFFLLAPLPAMGISQDVRGAEAACARHFLNHTRRARTVYQPIRYYGSFRRMMPFYMAALEPYLALCRPTMTSYIARLNERGEDWLQYRRADLR